MARKKRPVNFQHGRTGVIVQIYVANDEYHADMLDGETTLSNSSLQAIKRDCKKWLNKYVTIKPQRSKKIIPPITVPYGDEETEAALNYIRRVYAFKLDGQIGGRSKKQLPVNTSLIVRDALQGYAWLLGQPKTELPATVKGGPLGFSIANCDNSLYNELKKFEDENEQPDESETSG